MVATLLNRGWIGGSFSSICHLPAITSDHNPLILNTASLSFSLPKPFRFEEFWTKHPECCSVIIAAWDSFISGSSAFILARKLKSTKYALKIWNNLYFGNIKKKSILFPNKLMIFNNPVSIHVCIKKKLS